MGQKLSPQQIELYQEIDQILWKDWDPIGIHEYDDMRDEYYSYLPTVYNLTLENATELKIAEYLCQCINESMELSSTVESNIEVAQKIVQLKMKIGL